MYRKFFKRFLDIVISFSVLLCLSPLLLLLSVWLHFANHGAGAFFLQVRPGKGGKVFKVIKFKTMTDTRDAAGKLLPDEERITRVGAFVRSTSLDELMQFVNVLKGDMSLIGPRPEQKVFVEQFEQAIPFYNYRHIVKPGLSGWAQVTQGYASDTEETQVKIEYDFYYIKNFSFLLDLVTIAKTIRIIMTGFGAR